MIEQLPALVPDSARRDRTRARCHKALARQAKSRDLGRFAVERAMVLGLGAVYLSLLAFDVMRVLIR